MTSLALVAIVWGGIHSCGAQGQTADRPGASLSEGAAIFSSKCAKCHGPDGKGLAEFNTPDFTDPRVQARLSDQRIVTTIRQGKKGTLMQSWTKELSSREILLVAAYIRSLGSAQPQGSGQGNQPADRSGVYWTGDDVLYSLPTGRRLDRGGLYVNFTHRFALDPAFSGPARGAALGGLEGFSLSSFGFRYGITNRLSASIYRSPTFIARPIQLMLGYTIASEEDGAPLNAEVRVSTEGHNNFTRNFTYNLEAILSRSISSRAQVYVVPTISLNNHRLFFPSGYGSRSIPNLPGYNTFATGFGVSVDIRRTVAFVAEVMPTFVNGRPLLIHRPAFGFGIQKKIHRHAFTAGFTNSPGTTVSQRHGTLASYRNIPNADKIDRIVFGFNLTRQLF